jgi:hypothetical protein
MCFSATASFVASASLIATGYATIKNTSTKEQVPFASIPILFGVQQGIEGFVWLSLQQAEFQAIHTATVYGFLFFAQVFWPFWVPFSIWLIEKNALRKKILSVILFLGTIVAMYLAYCLVVFEPVASIHNHHIMYTLNFPAYFWWFSGLFYFVPTVLPPFFSSIKKMVWLGILVFLSFLVSKLFFFEQLISVWCFFAATMSVVVWYVLKKNPPKAIL